MRGKLTVIIQLLALLFSIAAYASEKKTSHVVRDVLASYYHGQIATDNLPRFVSIVEADFNCDGLPDLAITNSDQSGTGGATWIIYIRRSDGQFNEIGSVGTKANRFHITRGKHVGHLAVMLRGGPGDLLVVFYDISSTQLRKVGEEKVRLPEKQIGKTRIEEIFGDGYSGLPATKITADELRSKFP